MKEQIIELRHCFSMLASMASQVKVDQRTRQLINDRIDKNREVLDHLTAEQGDGIEKLITEQRSLTYEEQKIVNDSFWNWIDDNKSQSQELTVREVVEWMEDFGILELNKKKGNSISGSIIHPVLGATRFNSSDELTKIIRHGE